MSQIHDVNNSDVQVGDREIVIIREFDAPRELVFEAWTNVEQLAKWWGPDGFTTTFQKFELKTNGTWEFIMHSPDGIDFPNTSIFDDIVKPERIVFRHTVFPHFTASAIFEEQGVKTKLTYRTIFEETPEVFDKVKTYAVPGAEQTMDRLRNHLESLTS